jgi:anti-anti-sigma regulatory factor
MLDAIFSIRSTQPEVVSRGRLLKGAACIVGVAMLMALPIPLGNPIYPAWLPFGLVLMAALCAGVFLGAQYGHVIQGGLLLSAALIILISIAAPPDELLHRPLGTGYINAILIGGLVIGAHAVLITGLGSVLALLVVALVSSATWTHWTATNIVILLVGTGLLWLTIGTLERSRSVAQKQAEAARAAETGIAAQERELRQANQELTASNLQLTHLIELVRDLETPMIPITDDTILVPLIGHIDDRRMTDLMQTILQTIHQNRSRLVLIDLTGTLIEAGMTMRLLESLSAIRLLGADVVLSGISPTMAQRFITAGICFDGIITVQRLQQGVQFALTGRQILLN